MKKCSTRVFELAAVVVAAMGAAALPQAQLHLLPACGHMLTWEQPQAVAALLQAWLTALGRV